MTAVVINRWRSWKTVTATLIASSLIGGFGAMWGATAGLVLAEAALRLGLATYDSAVPDGEIDLWFPFAAYGGTIALFAGLVLGCRLVMKSNSIRADR